MKNQSYLYAMIVGTVLIGCSENTDSELRGTCNLSCSQARVPAGEYEIKPLAAEGASTFDMNCSAAFQAQNNSILPLNKPIQVKYHIYELVPAFGRRTVDPREDAEGVPAGGGENDIPPIIERIPKSGIGFEPLLYGAMATEKTHPDFVDGQSVSSGKFDGVVTPRSEWCSDTCGVMTYEFWPVCIEGATNNILASLVAGAASVKGVWRFNVTNTASTAAAPGP